MLTPDQTKELIERFPFPVEVCIPVHDMQEEDVDNLLNSLKVIGFAAMLHQTVRGPEIIVAEKL